MLQSLFNPENALMCFINKIIDLVVLSLVWLVCCIPIVTIGPACAALYYAVVKAVHRQRSYPVREFWRAFKSNLKKGILFEVIWLLLGAMMLYTDLPLVLTFLDTGKVQNVILLVLFGIKAVLLLGTACWIYPLMSRFEEKFWKLAQASVFLLMCYLPVTLAAIVLLTAAVILFLWEPLLLAVLPGPLTLLLSMMQEPALRKMCQASEAEAAASHPGKAKDGAAAYRPEQMKAGEAADHPGQESDNASGNHKYEAEHEVKDTWYLER